MPTHKINETCPCGQYEYCLSYKSEEKSSSEFQYCMFCGILHDEKIVEDEDVKSSDDLDYEFEDDYE